MLPRHPGTASGPLAFQIVVAAVLPAPGRVPV